MLHLPLVILKQVHRLHNDANESIIVVSFTLDGKDLAISIKGFITFEFDFGFVQDPFWGQYARIVEADEYVVIRNFHTHEMILEIAKD